MQKLGLGELRERYLKFFESKEHLRLKSFSLIPDNDPSLLLINSGMAPMKPYFSGEQAPPRKRVTTCQKCIRTPDIENVGKTSRHGTFFEMLGNFSFGDYFKEDAIKWGWEFFTDVLEIPKDRLWVSVYQDDDEAFRIWNEVIGLDFERIVRLGKEDNFWEHGLGPCGPCSEIYVDMGEKFGCGKDDCTVGCDCDRYVEVWNLVFTEFNKDEDGSYSTLSQKNIDTGMGLERLACVSQSVDNIFEVDTIRKILDTVCDMSGKTYGANYDNDVSIRVITDHIRSSTFMISDGVIPSNEARGYVLRRLIRRAARHGRLLGIDGMFLSDLAKVVIGENKDAYPELEEKAVYIEKVISNEEERFANTIDQGMTMLEDFFENSKEKSVPGTVAFKLHDTYGFPIDLTKEISFEKGFGVDEVEFTNEMNKQKDMAREALKKKGNDAWKDSVLGTLNDISTKFKGYTDIECEGKIQAIILNDEIAETVNKGDSIEFIPDETVFYAESGGQVSDKGIAITETGKVEVIECKKTADNKFIHIGVVTEGSIKAGQTVTFKIDTVRRRKIERNHSATHLLQKALRETLGEHINQAGSLVEPTKLRFDFTHFSALTEEEVRKVERAVNEAIFSAYEVDVNEMHIDEAKKTGAAALFGEKYSEYVRVVNMGDFSIEFCGGTHIDNISKIGLFKIISEVGIAAGVRRIEAITGEAVYDYLYEKEDMLSSIAVVLKANVNDIEGRIISLDRELKETKKQLADVKKKNISESFDDILKSTVDVNGVKVIKVLQEDVTVDELRNLSDDIKNRVEGATVVVLASVNGDKVNFIVTANKEAVANGVHSGNIVREVAKIAGGGGGGKPDMAQAGGKDASKVKEALDVVESLIGG